MSLRYHSIMSKTVAKIVILVVWICSIFIGIAPLIPGGFVEKSTYTSCFNYNTYSDSYIYFCFVFYCICYAIICVCYLRIYYVARKHTKRIRTESVSSENSCPKTNYRKNIWRITKTLAIVIGVVFLLMTPYYTVILFTTICGGCKVHFAIYAVTLILLYLNSCVNVFIYAGKDRDMKVAFKQLLHCKKGQGVCDTGGLQPTTAL